MKRYLIFGFDDYYPCGGMTDLIGWVDEKPDLKACEAFALATPDGTYENYNVLDLHTGQEIGL